MIPRAVRLKRRSCAKKQWRERHDLLQLWPTRPPLAPLVLCKRWKVRVGLFLKVNAWNVNLMNIHQKLLLALILQHSTGGLRRSDQNQAAYGLCVHSVPVQLTVCIMHTVPIATFFSFLQDTEHQTGYHITMESAQRTLAVHKRRATFLRQRDILRRERFNERLEAVSQDNVFC